MRKYLAKPQRAGLMILLLWAIGACSDDEKMKSVDLRYNPEESYLFSANAEGESFTFQVKSTDDWIVYGHSDWCQLSPSQGGPNEVYDVSVTCQENTSLDDRTDTIVVQSDYWIGTTFTVVQKGTAFLNVSPVEGEYILIPQAGGSATFRIQANQNWTIRIPEEANWLQADKLSGEQDEEIVLTVSQENTGEQRECWVEVLDRNGKADPSAGVRVVQEGVLLAPDITYSRVKAEGETIRVQVESNTQWTAAKGNVDDTWYELSGTEFNGTQSLDIIVQNNAGQSFREAEIILQTVVVEGSAPAVKRIRLKQGYNPAGKRYTFDANDWWADAGTPLFENGTVTLNGSSELTITRTDVGTALGTYSFHISSIDGNNTHVWTTYVFKPWIVFKWGMWSGGTSGWTNFTSETQAPGLVPNDQEIAPTYPRTLTMKLTAEGDDAILLEWILDGQTIGKYVMERANFNFESQAVGWLKLQCAGGGCTFDYFEYAPPLDWGYEPWAQDDAPGGSK